MIEFILGLTKVILLLCFYGITGFILLNSFKKKRNLTLTYTKLFLSIFIGLSFVISLLAIIKTNFQTVNLILFIVILYTIYCVRSYEHDKQIIDERYPFSTHPVLVSFIVTIILYTIIYFLFINIYYNQDYIYYSKISYYLFKTGFENDYQIYNLIDKDYNGVTPYHYFDLWHNAFNYFSFRTQSILDTLLTVSSTILIFIIFIGLLAINEIYKKVNILTIILACCIIFFGGFFMPLLIKIPFFLSFDYCFTPSVLFNVSKFSPTILFFIAAFIMLNIKKSSGLLIFATLPVVSIVLLPAVLMSISLLLLVILFNTTIRKNISTKQVIILYTPTIYVVIFYFIFGNKLIIRGGATLNDVFISLSPIKSPKTIYNKFNIVAGSIIVILAVYLPLLPLIYKSIVTKKSRNNFNELFIVVLLFTSSIGGALAWSILSPKMNAIQPFYYFVKVYPVILFIFICLSDNSIYKYFVILILILCSAFNLISALQKSPNNIESNLYKKQYNYVTSNIKLEGNVGMLKAPIDYKDLSDYYPTCYGIGIYLSSNIDSFFCIGLSDYAKLDNIDSNYKDGIIMGAFYRYVKQQKSNNNNCKIIDDCQIDFIKSKKIRFIIATKNVILSTQIKSITDTILTIPNSDDKLLRLKY